MKTTESAYRSSDPIKHSRRTLSSISIVDDLAFTNKIMSIQVKTFFDKDIEDAIKESPPIIKEYIDALKRIIDNDMKMMNEFNNKWKKVPPDIQAVINKEFFNLI